jgi:hypothetical protein
VRLPLFLLALVAACHGGSGGSADVSGIVIHEVSCAGDDWVELANLGSVPVNLDGWKVADREPALDPDRAVLLPPAPPLEPGGFRILYRDRDFPFGLACGDDTVYLSGPDGTVHASVALPVVHESQSWGRLPEAPGTFAILHPTAGAPNVAPTRFFETPTPSPTPGDGPCNAVNQRWGRAVCVDGRVDAATFDTLSVPDAPWSGVDRVTKFTAPVEPGAGTLPPLVQDVNLHPLHEDFLRAAFPELFPRLDTASYQDLVLRRATRAYFTGSLFRFADGGGYGFTVATDPLDEAERLTAGELAALHTRLTVLLDGAPPAYLLTSPSEIDRVSAWPAPGFPIRVVQRREPGIEVYSPGTAYGVVRIFRLADFREAQAAGTLAWTDIVVIDSPPTDIETIVAAVVTGGPQAPLNHVAIRTARRGAPNLYLPDATTRLAAHEGRLVRLDAFDGGYAIGEADAAEAEAFRAATRPNVELDDVLDETFEGLPKIAEIEGETPAARKAARRRFGSKATNLAVLYRYLPEAARVKGFAIPFTWYLRFVEQNRLTLADGRTMTYAQRLASIAADPILAQNQGLRHQALGELATHAVDHAVLPEGLVDVLATRIADVFGSPSAMVRFRSSSNLEDSLGFSGAGLYDSTSACALDFAGDPPGPSRCDPNKDAPRPIGKALVRVWSSLWNFRAWEEQAYHRIDPTRAAMAILVNDRIDREAANGVLFTAVPWAAGDRRFVVNAQWMDVDVVSPPEGALTETDLVGWDGTVATSVRIGTSNLVAPGQVALRQEDIQELVRLAAPLRDAFPIDDLGGRAREDVLLDLEWKRLESGGFTIKQIRPFLLSEAQASSDVLVSTPTSSPLCGTFVDDRSVWRQRDLGARLHLESGTRALPFDPSAFPIEASWIQSLEFGPEGVPLPALGPGRFTLAVSSTWIDVYEFGYQQDFGSAEAPVRVRWRHRVTADVGVAPKGGLVSLAAESSGFEVYPGTGDVAEDRMPMAPCRMDWLDPWVHRARIDDPTFPVSAIEIRIGHRPQLVESGSVTILEARVTTPAGTTQVASGAFDVTYATLRHNESEDFLIRLGVPGAPTGYVLLDEPGPHEAWGANVVVLDAALQPLDARRATDWSKGPLE